MSWCQSTISPEPGIFVIELRRVELDVGADQIGGDIGERRLAADAPEIGMAIDQRAQPAHMRMVRPVLRADVEFLVRRRNRAALVDEFGRTGAQQFQPLVRDQSLGGKKPCLKIALALFLGQHARLLLEDCFGRHGSTVAFGTLLSRWLPIGARLQRRRSRDKRRSWRLIRRRTSPRLPMRRDRRTAPPRPQ